MLPDFFIVGAAKCGTTALYHFLDKHPDIYMSPVKEPNHFCTDIRPQHFSEEFRLHEKQKNFNLHQFLEGPMKEKQWGYFVEERSDYEKLFKNRTREKAAGEVSNSYLYSSAAAANIRLDVPLAKIIMMLRHPAERAYSHYLAHVRDGKTYLPFRKEIESDMQKFPKGWGQSYLYLEMGLYFEQVKRYTNTFPASQIKIYLYDDFKQDAAAVMQDLFGFLGVETPPSMNFNEIYNEARKPVSSRLNYIISRTGLKKKVFQVVPDALRKKIKNLFFISGKVDSMNAADRSFLINYYQADVAQLEKLINRDLSSWKI